jgi:hypothetical protein
MRWVPLGAAVVTLGLTSIPALLKSSAAVANTFNVLADGIFIINLILRS